MHVLGVLLDESTIPVDGCDLDEFAAKGYSGELVLIEDVDPLAQVLGARTTTDVFPYVRKKAVWPSRLNFFQVSKDEMHVYES